VNKEKQKKFGISNPQFCIIEIAEDSAVHYLQNQFQNNCK